MRRSDRVVRLGLDSRGEPDEHGLDACLLGPPDLLQCVEHDERAGPSGRLQLAVRLVVPVEHEAFARDPGAQRKLELPERGHVCAEPLGCEQAQQGDVGERLRPVDEQRARRCLPVRAHLIADRALAVDDERRPVPMRELARAHPAERQLACLDPRRFRKDFEHLASIGSVMQELLLS